MADKCDVCGKDMESGAIIQGEDVLSSFGEDFDDLEYAVICDTCLKLWEYKSYILYSIYQSIGEYEPPISIPSGKIDYNSWENQISEKVIAQLDLIENRLGELNQNQENIVVEFAQNFVKDYFYQEEN